MASDVPADLSTFADRLADAAGAVIRKYWRTRVEVISRTQRPRVFADEPVTIADRESERVMRDMIERRYPRPRHSGQRRHGGGPAARARWAWVLDPVDGAKSFITGKPLFGTLIALLNYGKPVLGVIDQCVSNGRALGKKRPSMGCLVRRMTVRHSTKRWSTRRRPRCSRLVWRARVELLELAVQAPSMRLDATRGLCASTSVQLVCEADLMPYDYPASCPWYWVPAGVIIGLGGPAPDATEPRPIEGTVLCAANAKAAFGGARGAQAGASLFSCGRGTRFLV